MVAPHQSGRSRFTLFILLLASATLLTLDARGFGPVEQFKNGIAAAVSPFRSAADTAFSPVGNAWENFSNSDDLEAENARLRSELEQIRSQIIADGGAAEDLELLREQLLLQNTEGYNTLVAEVTAGSVSNFDPFVFDISRGTADGVVGGMPVITAGGLIGRIDDVFLRTARVRIISDPSLSVGVLIVGTDEIGILSGGGSDEPLKIGKGTIRVDAEVEIGNVVQTSGGDRSLYPPGLPVGTVIGILNDEGSLEKVVEVEPSASLQRFEFVTIVLFDPVAGGG